MEFLSTSLSALMLFTLLWSMCCVGFLVVIGSFPLQSTEGGGAVATSALAIVNAVMLLGFVALTLTFGWTTLPMPTFVVAAGLVFLFAPTPIEIVPARWRDGKMTLLILLAVQSTAIGTLVGRHEAFVL